MRLQAEPPLRMAQAIVDRARGVLDHVGSVHRLQREALEGEIGEILRRRIRLRIDQLEFMAPAHHEIGAGLRADADPVHAGGRIDRAVGLDADLEAARMQRVDQGRIDLQQRLAAGQHHVAVLASRRSIARRWCRRVPRPRHSGRPACRRCRQNRCRRTGRSRWRGPVRGRSRDCSRRNGKTPPRGRHARLRPAGSERFL